MLYYDRIDVSEGIDVNKTKASKEGVCHYWYFVTYLLNLVVLKSKNKNLTNIKSLFR